MAIVSKEKTVLIFIYSETSGCEHPESVNTPYSEHFSPVPFFSNTF